MVGKYNVSVTVQSCYILHDCMDGTLKVHIVKHNEHTHGYPAHKQHMYTRCTHDVVHTVVHLCLLVQLNSYRFIECVGWRIHILHIHIILKHTAHTHGRGYPSPKNMYTRCVHVSGYFRMEYLSVCPTKFISFYRMCRLAHTNTTHTHHSDT